MNQQEAPRRGPFGARVGEAVEVVEYGYVVQPLPSNPGIWKRQCFKCGGTGEVWATHVFNGVCFRCAGSGVGGKSFPSLEAATNHMQGLRKAAVARQEKKDAERAAKIAEWEAHAAEEARIASEEAMKRAEALAQYQWLPAEVGEKVEIVGKVKMIRYIAGEWNRSSTRLVVVEMPGFEVKFFSGAAWVWDIEEGQEISFSAAVKAHEEFNGKKATQVVRPKVSK
jgi:hypothetical protein